MADFCRTRPDPCSKEFKEALEEDVRDLSDSTEYEAVQEFWTGDKTLAELDAICRKHSREQKAAQIRRNAAAAGEGGGAGANAAAGGEGATRGWGAGLQARGGPAFIGGRATSGDAEATQVGPAPAKRHCGSVGGPASVDGGGGATVGGGGEISKAAVCISL